LIFVKIHILAQKRPVLGRKVRKFEHIAHLELVDGDPNFRVEGEALAGDRQEELEPAP
jgi:hypothetical protein